MSFVLCLDLQRVLTPSTSPIHQRPKEQGGQRHPKGDWQKVQGQGGPLWIGCSKERSPAGEGGPCRSSQGEGDLLEEQAEPSGQHCPLLCAYFHGRGNSAAWSRAYKGMQISQCVIRITTKSSVPTTTTASSLSREPTLCLTTKFSLVWMVMTKTVEPRLLATVATFWLALVLISTWLWSPMVSTSLPDTATRNCKPPSSWTRIWWPRLLNCLNLTKSFTR